MNVLIVDDQKMIADNLKTSIKWSTLHVDSVFTAYSAMEAKLVLVNFEIDLLISDIEMPAEDGLQLYRWAKKRYPDLECIFLTSHAEFEYAKEAVQLGGFDYILQPARYIDVEAAVARVYVRIEEKFKRRKLESSTKLVLRQRDLLLESMIQKQLEKKDAEAELVWRHLRELIQLEYQEFICYTMQIKFLLKSSASNNVDMDLWSFIIHNILTELVSEVGGSVCVARYQVLSCLVLAVGDKDTLTSQFWKQMIESFYSFISDKFECEILINSAENGEESPLQCIHRYNTTSSGLPVKEESGIFWLNSYDEETMNVDDGELRIHKALEYIQNNLNRNISRADIAKVVFLNEDYFSRLFKQETGYNYKDYTLMKKMKLAKHLLRNTKLSISIVASKVGYDNFSHFSKMFKKMSGMTPQEYRKDVSKS